MGIHTKVVQELYVAYFGRPADAAGLTFWEGVVAKANGSTAAVSAEFAASKEYKDTYAGKSEYQIINTIYQNLFGRDAEKGGLEFWGQALMRKDITIDNAVAVIASAAQGTDKTIFANKVTAATSFTAALDTAAEMVNYSGTAANAIAKTWMAGITTDASLAAAITEAALNNIISVIIDNGPGSVGQTFVLSQGQDLLVGTGGNDVFTVNAFNTTTGAAATNMSLIDSIDGGAGKDTLNVEMKDTINTEFAGTIKNVEIVNLNQSALTTAVAVDASKFVGATTINQIGKAGAVTKLAAGTTAAFTSQAAAAALSVGAAGATAAVSLASVDETATLAVSGATLNSVTVSGALVDGSDGGTTVGNLALTVTAGKDVQTVAINAGMNTTLVLNEDAAATKKITSVDASASAGGITYVADADTLVIATGAGKDTVTLASATLAATSTAAAVNGSVSTGAGDDAITVTTTGSGATTVDAGAGNDSVTITTRGSGKLTVTLGDGSDSFTAAVAAPVGAGDSIDAGAGTDTLALKLVGSANIGAFSNFDLFDAAGLAKELDVDILAAKNEVAEFIASGDVGAGATLTNVGAGVGVRVTADMAASTLIVNQKTAGAITMTVDADETGTADDGAETITASLSTKATSVKAVFDTSYLADTTAEKALAATADNYTTLSLTANAATAVEVVSGGANAGNLINISASDKLELVTVNGAQSLTIGTITGATELATIDASALTGSLIASTAAVIDGGTIKLGSGADVITLVAAGTDIESISGIEKTAAVAVSTAAADATAAAAAIADADVLSLGAGTFTVADANATVTAGTIAKGVLTFTGAGPATLNEAFDIADLAAETAGEAVVFEYLGNSYVFVQGATDIGVKLVGVTGVTNFAEAGTTNNFFLV